MLDGRDTVEDLIDEIYPDLHDLPLMLENSIRQVFNQRVVLAVRNNYIDSINNALLQMLPDDSKTYIDAGSTFNDPQ